MLTLCYYAINVSKMLAGDSKEINMDLEVIKQKQVRMPEDLIWKIKEAAVRNRRSENQEMLIRLESSFDERVEKVMRECL